MRISRLLFLMFAVFVISAHYSSLSAQRYLEMPLHLQYPKESDLEQLGGDVNPGQIWRVFSDRSNNTTYTSPGGSELKNNLEFLDEFFVLQVKENYLHLFKDPNITGLDQTSGAVDYGWIHKDNLILSSHCLVTETKVAQKAMILNTLKDLERQNGIEPDIVKFRDSPMDNGGEIGKSLLFEFFFVMKIDENAHKYLLAKQEIIMGTTIDMTKGEVVGWAPDYRITPWNHRVALEPNWEPKAIQERKNGKNKKAIFVATERIANNYQKNERISENDIIWDNDTYETRPIGEFRRFPALDISLDYPNVLVTGVMGNLVINGMKLDDETTAAVDTLKNILNDVIAKKRKINIVFVVDGTSSVRGYFADIKSGIDQSINSLKKRTKNKLYFGAAIYRDFPEAKAIQLFKCHELVSADDSYEIKRFFDLNAAGDKFDIDKPEAVYYGLEKALYQTGITDKEEINVIILIGDAGNRKGNDLNDEDRKSGVTHDSVVKNLGSLRCNFLAYQVKHELLNTDSVNYTYDDFIDQTKKIIDDTSKIIYTDDISRSNDQTRGNIKEPSLENVNNYTFRVMNSSFYGEVVGLPEGGGMKAGELKDKVVEFISLLDNATTRVIGDFKDVDTGKGFLLSADQQSDNPVYDNLRNGIIPYLKRAPREFLRNIADNKYQLYVKGATSMYVHGQDEPIFKYVLFFNKDEFYDLVQQMKTLSTKRSRKELYDTWIQLLRSQIGNISDEEIGNLTVGQIDSMTIGIPSRGNDFVKKLRLPKILDIRELPDTELQRYIDVISNKYEELRKIWDAPSSDYKYSFRSNELTYFWIEEDLLP